MATDDERREVARNIRENYIRGGMGYRTASAYNIALAVGIVPEMLVEDIELWNRLADLIEPSIPADPGEAGLACVDAFIREHTEKPVDREALLALADEIEYGASSDDGEYHDLPATMVAAVARKQMEYARSIREALGVSDD